MTLYRSLPVDALDDFFVRFLDEGVDAKVLTVKKLNLSLGAFRDRCGHDG